MEKGGGSMKVLVRLYDDSQEMAFAWEQRVIKLFRRFFYSGHVYVFAPLADGGLRRAMRQAIDSERLKWTQQQQQSHTAHETSAFVCPKLVSTLDDPVVQRMLEECGADSDGGTHAAHNDGHVISFVYGNNVEYLRDFADANPTRHHLIVIQQTGQGALQLEQVLAASHLEQKLYSDSRRVLQLMEESGFVIRADPCDIQGALDHWSDAIMCSGVPDEAKLNLLIEWGEIYKVCAFISKLKTMDSGRMLLEKLFWETLAAVILKGDGNILSTILYHNVVPLEAICTEENINYLFTSWAQKYPDSTLGTYLLNYTSFSTTGEFTFETLNEIQVDLYSSVSGKTITLEMSKQNGYDIVGLWIFTVLTLNNGVSMQLWKQIEQKFSHSLVVCYALREIGKKPHIACCINKMTKLDQAMKFYEDISIDMLMHYHAADPLRLKCLLVKLACPLTDGNPIGFAADAELKTLFAKQPVLDLISDVWTGAMPMSETASSVLWYILFPPLILAKKFADKPLIKNLKSQQMVDLSRANISGPCEKLCAFYRAPLTKYVFSFLSYVGFLVMFSYMMLNQLKEPSPSRLEMMVTLFVVIYAGEEVIQFMRSARSWRARFAKHFANQWNHIDVAFTTFYMVGFMIRLRVTPELVLGLSMEYLAECLYVTTIILCYIRLLFYLSLNKQLGPYIIMLQFMFEDLRCFLVILFAIVLGFGIGMESLMENPNSDNKVWSDFWGYLMKPTMQMYGFSLFLDDITEAFNCTASSGSVDIFSGCKGGDFRPHFMVVLVFAFYLVTGVILLNLLIAIFSDTYARVRENTSLYWNFVFYEAVTEFTDRTVFPCPLIAIGRGVQVLCAVMRWVRRSLVSKKTQDFDLKPDPIQEDDLMKWARYLENEYVLTNFYDKK